MKRAISKFLSILFATVLLVTALGASATPALADNDPNQTIGGQMDWTNSGNGPLNYWIRTDLGSAIVSSDVPRQPSWGTAGRTRNTVFHLHQSNSCVSPEVCGSWVSWLFAKSLNNPTTVYYSIWVEAISFPSPYVWSVGGGATHTGSGLATGSFNVDWNYGGSAAVSVTANPPVDPAKEFDIMVYASFSLDPNPKPPDGDLKFLTARVFLDSTEMVDTVEHPRRTAWFNTLPQYFEEANYLLGKNGAKVRYFWDGQLTEQNNVYNIWQFDITGFCSHNWHGTSDIKIWFATGVGDIPWWPPQSADGMSFGRDCNGYGAIVINADVLSSNDYKLYTRQEATAPGTCLIDVPACQIFLQISTDLIHELVHSFGGYAVEAYDFAEWADQTLPTYSPDASIQAKRYDAQGHEVFDDAWWLGQTYGFPDEHSGYYGDPMSGVYEAYLQTDTFSSLESRVDLTELTLDYLNQTRDTIGQLHIAADPVGVFDQCGNVLGKFSYLQVGQKDAEGRLMSDITVHAWLMWRSITQAGEGQNYSDLGVQETNGSGLVTFPLVDQFGYDFDFVCPSAIPIGRAINYAVLLKSYDALGNQYGDPQIIDAYNMQMEMMDNPEEIYYITQMTSPYASHTVYFDANGGTGTMLPQTADRPTQLSANGFSRANYAFTGWNEAANGSGVSHAKNEIYSFAADLTLYAQWVAEPLHVQATVVDGQSRNVTGWIQEDPNNLTHGGSYTTSGTPLLRMGDTTTRLGYRSVVQFDTSGIPDNAVITSASITFGYQGMSGSNSGWGPTGHTNDIAIYVPSSGSCFGNCYLENGDFEAAVQSTPVGYVVNAANSTPPSPVTYNPVTFTTLLDHISKTGVTEFKVRWYRTSDTDSTSDQLVWYGYGDIRPTIDVAYYIP